MPARHPDGPLTPEAIYWRGIAAYLKTRDNAAMYAIWQEILDRFPDSIWARRLAAASTSSFGNNSSGAGGRGNESLIERGTRGGGVIRRDPDEVARFPASSLPEQRFLAVVVPPRVEDGCA